MARVLVWAGAICLLLLSAVVATEEAAPFLLRAHSPEHLLGEMSGADSHASRVSRFESRIARSSRLEACLNLLRGLTRSVTTSRATVRSVADGCKAIAEGIVARSPLDSNAWFLGASLAEQLRETEQAERYLNLSFVTGRSEQWIAERRALFGYRLRDRLAETTRLRVDQDIALLLRTDRGIDVLANHYVDDPAMREYLVGIAETLAPDDQRRFARRVRNAIGESAGN